MSKSTMILIFLAVFFIVLPLFAQVTIWALNLVFPTLAIPHTYLHGLAVGMLSSIVYGKTK